jgi:acyl-CoA synthetase (AMP-forming)/AMP-acid ligase II
MIFRSPWEDVLIPELSLPELLLESAENHHDKPALIDGPSGRTLTFGDLAAAIRKAAKGFATRGLKKGESIALYAPNLPEYAVAFHGAALIGGVATTINPLYTVEELSSQLQDAHARYLITIPPLLDKAKQSAEETGIEEVFVFGEANGATPFGALLENDGDAPKVDIDPAKDVIALPYSSGTTGLQKGVMLTHRNLVANVVQTGAVLGDDMGSDDVIIGVLPFFHIYGMEVVMSLALHKGASVVTMPRFDLEGFLALMQNRRVTVGFLVPPIVLALANHPAVSRYDLSSVQWIMSGAAPLGKQVSEKCAKRLGCRVFQGYGLTETSPVSHCNPPGAGRAKPGSVGPPVPNTECKIVDPSSDKELAVGEEGEIWIRGPQVMKGYLDHPEATAACMDDAGFFHSGDIGYADDDSYFFVVDRMKELIKYKGMQVAPAELEALLLSHPSIRDAAVVPFPDEEAGEIPKAFVVVSEPMTGEAVESFVAGHVAPHKKIRAVEFIDQIPKSPSGKILRRVLVERDRAKA